MKLTQSCVLLASPSAELYAPSPSSIQAVSFGLPRYACRIGSCVSYFLFALRYQVSSFFKIIFILSSPFVSKIASHSLLLLSFSSNSHVKK